MSRESRGEPLRVIHCPDLVGGHAPELARAERALGLDSRAIAWAQSKFHYPCDEILGQATDSRLRRLTQRFRLFFRLLRDCDVVHFNFGQTTMPMQYFPPDGARRSPFGLVYAGFVGLLELRDLWWLKRAGKRIAITFQGDDARQGDRITDFDHAAELEPGYYTHRSDEHKRWRIAKIARYADIIYALNPDLLRLLPSTAKFLPYANVNLDAWQPAESPSADRPPLVLHAPTHRGVKGTRYVLDAVARLKAEGVQFEFQLVENLARDEARMLYERADLLVDQLLLGWYGGLAVELMALGRPVITYIRESDLGFVPSAMRDELPIINATRESIYAILRDTLTTRRRELPELGRRCRAFVERWHSPAAVARQTLADYGGVAFPV